MLLDTRSKISVVPPSKAAQSWLSFNQTRSNLGPTSSFLGPFWSNLGQIRVNSGRNRARFGRILANVD